MVVAGLVSFITGCDVVASGVAALFTVSFLSAFTVAAAAGAVLLIQLWFTDLYGPELRTLVLPVALSFPAFGYYCVVLSRMIGLKENKMTHRQRDLICDRLPVGAVLFLIFSGLAFLASVWGAIALGATPGRLLYAADALAQTVLAVLLFRGRKSLTTERL